MPPKKRDTWLEGSEKSRFLAGDVYKELKINGFNINVKIHILLIAYTYANPVLWKNKY